MEKHGWENQEWHRWEDNTKMKLEEIGYANVEWINLTQNKDMR
jgi:hypothetical protein